MYWQLWEIILLGYLCTDFLLLPFFHVPTDAFCVWTGSNSSNPFWNLIRDLIKDPSPEQVSCHKPKPILLDTGDVSIVSLFVYFEGCLNILSKLRTALRSTERKMLDWKIKDKVPCSEVRKRTKIIWHYRIHTDTKIKMGWSCSKNEWMTIDGIKPAQSGNQGVRTKQWGDPGEDGKMT